MAIEPDVTRRDQASRVVLTSAQSCGRVAALELLLERGVASVRHVHTREDELFYVLDGRISVLIDEVWSECGTGSCVFLPKGSDHAYVVESESARLLVVMTPAGLEAFFDDLLLVNEGDVERLVAQAASYGIEITGPAPGARQG